MTTSFGALWSDPVRDEVQEALTRIAAGELVDASCERRWFDLKEEAGRRNKTTAEIVAKGPREERVAKQLAAESACMANSPGGGALLVGIANDGTLVGAETDAEWLRQRIFELTQRLVTPEVREVTVRGTRLLVVFVPEAVEPVRYDGRIRWRVNDKCVEVDAATWHAKRIARLRYDWSADSSTIPAHRARPAALALARDFLSDANGEDLADQTDMQLLRRLNAVNGQDELSNAGAIVFVGREVPSVDYIYRDVAGADSLARVRRSNRSLLEELAEVFQQIELHNEVRHVQSGLVVRQVVDLPRLAAREAVVNGLAHRDWAVSEPTVVEHVGRTLRVTSPGGFYGGVNETNILTHPSTSRNNALTQLLADLKVAEREGVGVDRMVREMVRLGHTAPSIREIEGPYVRASLVGDNLDLGWLEWIGRLQPTSEARDVNSLLILQRIVTQGWVDQERAAELIQLPEAEAAGALTKLAECRVDGSPVLTCADGVPQGATSVWCLSDDARRIITEIDVTHGRPNRWPERAAVAVSYARDRGRISTTELASLVGASASNVGGTLKDLQAQGRLEASTPTGRGRGFYYRWIESGPPARPGVAR